MKHGTRKLAEQAESLGLDYIESRSCDEVGEIKGKLNNVEISVVQSSDARVTARFKHNLNIELYLTRPHMKNPELTNFKTNDMCFNIIFGTKRAGTDIIQKLEINTNLINVFVSFYDKWMFKIEELRISFSHLRCFFNWGEPFHYFIPSAMLQPICNDITVLVNLIERELC